MEKDKTSANDPSDHYGRIKKEKNEPPHSTKPAPSDTVCEAGFVQCTARFLVES